MEVEKENTEPDVAREATFLSPVSPPSSPENDHAVVTSALPEPVFHQIGSVDGGATPLDTLGTPTTTWMK